MPVALAPPRYGDVAWGRGPALSFLCLGVRGSRQRAPPRRLRIRSATGRHATAPARGIHDGRASHDRADPLGSPERTVGGADRPVDGARAEHPWCRPGGG